MEIKGLIVNDKKEVQYFIAKYENNTLLRSVPQMEEAVEVYSDVFDIKGVEIKDGELKVTQDFPIYQLEGIEKVRSIIDTLENSAVLKRKLRGNGEREVELLVSVDSICVSKSFRNDEFFTDYDYEKNGYNDAEFIGSDAIKDIVTPYLKDIVEKDNISCSGGDKLWFSVEVYCNTFAKLVEFK